MRLIETIIRKFFQMLPESLNFSSVGVRMLYRSFNKLALHFLHQVDFLFTHGLSKRIRLTTSKSANFLRNLHKLLLINQNSISIFKSILHMIFIVSNWLFTVFSSNKFWNFAHWPRSIKCNHGDNIFKL